MFRVLTLFGTRPEIIKLAPILNELEQRRDRFQTHNVASGQHQDLLRPFAEEFDVRIDRDLAVMEHAQRPAEVLSRVLSAMAPVLVDEMPDLVLVQGDTTTALAGALAAFYGGHAVGHVEAGLRSGNPANPFPEEMNRRTISQLARFHFAPTEHNAATLRAEGVAADRIAVCGNSVVTALHQILDRGIGAELPAELDAVANLKWLVVTTHRRESFGDVMAGNLRVLREYVEQREDVALIFPVHPNPEVRKPTEAILRDAPRTFLLPPLGYPAFIQLLSRAWLIVSDSGGVQEEAPTLGKALLVLRQTTERPEAVDAGVARLAPTPEALRQQLADLTQDEGWVQRVTASENPFGTRDSAVRIADALEEFLHAA